MINIKCYDGVDLSFSREDVHISDKLFDRAVENLVNKGMVELYEKNGKTCYRLTIAGIMAGDQLIANRGEAN